MRFFIVVFLVGIIILSGCVNTVKQKPNTGECSVDSDCQNKIQTRCIGIEPKCVGGKCQISRCLEISECFSDSDCTIGGCSSQVCTTKEKVSDLVTTCEYKQEYSCLQKTSCGCSQNKCQWDYSKPEYRSCIDSLPKDQEHIY